MLQCLDLTLSLRLSTLFLILISFSVGQISIRSLLVFLVAADFIVDRTLFGLDRR